MHRQLECAIAVLLLAGCVENQYEDRGVFDHPPYGTSTRMQEVLESRYRTHLYESEKGYGFEGDPESTRVENISAVLKKYESRVKVSLMKVVVGLPPNERVAGYVECREFPKVELYNRDTGRYESVNFVFNYIRDVDLSPLPKAIVLADGQTIIVGRLPGQDYVIGRFPLEIASLIALHICPVCGTVVHPNVFMNAARIDIDADRVSGFKDAMVFEHTRINRDYRPMKGLPEEFWRHPGGHACAAAGEKEFGESELFPVRFERVDSSALRARHEVKVEPSEKPSDESGE